MEALLNAATTEDSARRR
jgi:hypothetical protein